MTQFVKERALYADSFHDITIQTSDEAYIRPTHSETGTVWGIYNTDGTEIGHANSREVAMAVAFQNDLIPLNVH